MYRLSIALFAVLAIAGCSSFTVRADLSKHTSGDFVQWLEKPDGSWHRVAGAPLATVSVGFEPQLTDTVSANFGIEHTSLPGTDGDRGEERVYAGLAWRPFAGCGR